MNNSNIGSFTIDYFQNRAKWKTLLVGQLLSFLLACTGATNKILQEKCNFSAPASTTGIVYLLLSFHLCIALRRRRDSCDGGIREYSQNGDVSSAVQTEICDGGGTVKWSVTNERTDDDLASSDGAARREPTECHIPEDTTFELASPASSPSQRYASRIHAPPLVYFVIALLDVEASYFTFLSFRYTTFVSVALLDALAIPTAMIASRFLLKREYHCWHVIGAMVCIIGVVVNVMADAREQQRGNRRPEEDDAGQENPYPDKMLGDILAMIGGLTYGLNDVLSEVMVKKFGGVDEYVGMIGVWGVFISFIQAVLLERHSVFELFTYNYPDYAADDLIPIYGDEFTASASPSISTLSCSKSKITYLIILYAVLGYLSYIGMCHYLVKSEAALMNLSLLTGDLWALGFTVVAEKVIPSSLFWVALVLIFVGVLLYEISPSPMLRNADDSEGCDFSSRETCYREQEMMNYCDDDRSGTCEILGDLVLREVDGLNRESTQII